MLNLTQDVKKGKLMSAYVNTTFDKGKDFLEEKGYKIISAENMARLRTQEGPNAEISKYGNWAKEGVLYIPDKGTFFTKKSPIIERSFEATDTDRNGEWYYLRDAQVESALADSVKVSTREIPTNRFAEEELTSYLFGKDAKAYGESLRKNGLYVLPVYLANLKGKPFATQLWICGLIGNGRSALLGHGRHLSDNLSRVRGTQQSIRRIK